jgi:hypothetical protein
MTTTRSSIAGVNPYNNQVLGEFAEMSDEAIDGGWRVSRGVDQHVRHNAGQFRSGVIG